MLGYASGEPAAHVFLWSYLDALVPQNPRILLLGGGIFVGAAFLEACQALGHLVAADTAAVQPLATGAPGTRRPGFMERLLGPFAS